MPDDFLPTHPWNIFAALLINLSNPIQVANPGLPCPTTWWVMKLVGMQPWRYVWLCNIKHACSSVMCYIFLIYKVYVFNSGNCQQLGGLWSWVACSSDFMSDYAMSNMHVAVLCAKCFWFTRFVMFSIHEIVHFQQWIGSSILQYLKEWNNL